MYRKFTDAAYVDAMINYSIDTGAVNKDIKFIGKTDKETNEKAGAYLAWQFDNVDSIITIALMKNKPGFTMFKLKK